MYYKPRQESPPTREYVLGVITISDCFNDA